jgi:predicted nucleotide-binding protein (sugar kinase/HSP70/actin superfamily)
MKRVENKMYRLAHKWMYDRYEPHIGDIISEGGKYLPINFEGEAILTVGRTVEFINNGAAMVVNCSPFSCMPGTITGLILQKIQSQTGVPIVSIFYDGESDLNKVLGIHLQQIRRNNGNK